jgi:nucleoside-diphosphate-sugar epimerase
MRFDLTVNEFVRDLHLKGEIAVYGEQFWRPYAHIHDVATVMSTHANYLPRNTPINVGSNKFNYRKGTLARVLRNHVGGGNIKLVHKEEDPRDYRVRFDYLEESVKLGTDVESTAGDIIAALNAARRAGLS